MSESNMTPQEPDYRPMPRPPAGPPDPAGRALRGDIARLLFHWVKGQFIVAGIMAGIYAVAFYLLNVPLWFLVGFLCGVLHLVPLFGPILGLLVPVGAVLLGGGGAFQVLAVIGVYVVAQAVESFFITPKILGTELQMRPLLVFVAGILGGMMFGFIGLLFAVPVLAVAMLVWRTLSFRHMPHSGHRAGR
jgi:predicted PurR-regulated permease PerM